MKRSLALAALMLLAACSTLPPKTYHLDATTDIIVMEESQIKDAFGTCGIYVAGNPNRIYVPYAHQKDALGHQLPDMEILGHELWHKVAGAFHTDPRHQDDCSQCMQDFTKDEFGHEKDWRR